MNDQTEQSIGKIIASIKQIWPPFAELDISQLSDQVGRLKIGGTDKGEAVLHNHNSIFVIQPRRLETGTWVFTDPKRGLLDEPFVDTINDMLDWMSQDIPEAEKGIRVMFSAIPFPNHQITLNRVGRGTKTMGTDYVCQELNVQGWLCPALLCYFQTPPKQIFGAVMALE